MVPGLRPRRWRWARNREMVCGSTGKVTVNPNDFWKSARAVQWWLYIFDVLVDVDEARSSLTTDCSFRASGAGGWVLGLGPCRGLSWMLGRPEDEK